MDKNEKLNEALMNITKEEHLENIAKFTNPKNSSERLMLHLATTYVKENLSSLDNKDLKALVENEVFVKKLGDDFEKKLNYRYTNYHLLSFNKQKCIDTFAASNKPRSKEENFQFHLALTYFKDNIMSFDAKELQNIRSHEYVQKNTGKKFDSEIMSQCIRENKSFPITLPKWKDGSIARATISSYLKILAQENNEEQLRFFAKNRPYDFSDFIEQQKVMSPLLEELYLENDHKYIFRINWTEEKKCEWFNQNKNLAQALFGALYLYENTPNPKLKNLIFEEIKDKLFDSDFSDNNIYNKRGFLSGHNTEFVTYIEKKYPNELKEVLAQEIKADSLTCNFAQDLIFCSINFSYGDAKPAKKLYKIICDNKELLLKPIKVESSLYEKEISFFEHGLNNSNFLMFCPFNLNNVKEPEHKEQLLAAAFCLLQIKHNAYNNYDEDGDRINIDNYNYLKSWYPNIIEQATPEQVTRYANRAMRGNEDNTKFVKELEALKLKIDLQSNLSNDNLVKNTKVKL